MKDILRLLIRYGNHALFVMLEVICFYMIINYNITQRSIFLNSSSVYATKISKMSDELTAYARLQNVNDSLMAENKVLLERIIQSNITTNQQTLPVQDSTFSQYALIPTTICSKTLHLKNNHFTLCKGSEDGIRPHMGVITPQGVVGIVREVSAHYAHVVTVLHSQSRISAAVKGDYAFGNLVWEGEDHQLMTLEGVPKHVPIQKGDTVITSGYSTLFPPNIEIGTIESVELLKGLANYRINVRLFCDLTTVNHVYVVRNVLAEEQISVENE